MRKTRLLSWILVGVMVAGEAATPLASVAAQVNTVTDASVLETYTGTEEETTEGDAGEAEGVSEETENLETADAAEKMSEVSAVADTEASATAMAQIATAQATLDTDSDSTSALRGSCDTMDDTYTTSDGYEYTLNSDGATITGYTGSATNLTIPSTVGGYSVLAIGGYALSGNTTIISVTIPDTVLTIEKMHFKTAQILLQ